jgi:hypothetical protein
VHAILFDLMIDYSVSHLTKSKLLLSSHFDQKGEFDLQKWTRKIFKIYKTLQKTERHHQHVVQQ